jgi:hypothetical protein
MTAIVLLGPRTGALPWRCMKPPVNFAHRFSLLVVALHLRSTGISSDYCYVCHGICKRSSFQIPRHRSHVLSSWQLRPILRLPVIDPRLITCNDYWEKGIRISFTRPRILLRKTNLSFLNWSQHSQNPTRTDLRHAQTIMVDNRSFRHMQSYTPWNDCPAWLGLQFSGTLTGLPGRRLPSMESIPHWNCLGQYVSWYTKGAVSPHTVNIYSHITLVYSLPLRGIWKIDALTSQNSCLYAGRFVYTTTTLQVSNWLGLYCTHNTDWWESLRLVSLGYNANIWSR